MPMLQVVTSIRPNMTRPPVDRDEQSNFHVGNWSPGDLAMFQKLADATAEATQKRLLISMGLNPNDPLASQADFAALRQFAKLQQDDERKKDDAWTRRMRLMTEGIIGKIVLTTVGVLVLHALTTFWGGLKAYMRAPPP